MRPQASFGGLDFIAVIGFICFIVGVALIHIPTAVILFGLGLMILAWLLA